MRRNLLKAISRSEFRGEERFVGETKCAIKGAFFSGVKIRIPIKFRLTLVPFKSTRKKKKCFKGEGFALILKKCQFCDGSIKVF